MRASSTPSVVSGAVARMDNRLRWEALGEHPHRREECVPVGARQVDAADGAGEEQVAAEELAFGVEGDVGRRVARDGEALEGDACDLDRLVAAQEVLGRVRPPGNADRRELRVALEPFSLPLGHPDLGAGSFGKVGDTAEMVEVSVCDEDPGTGRVEPGELQTQVVASPPGSITAHSGALRSRRTT